WPTRVEQPEEPRTTIRAAPPLHRLHEQRRVRARAARPGRPGYVATPYRPCRRVDSLERRPARHRRQHLARLGPVHHRRELLRLNPLRLINERKTPWSKIKHLIAVVTAGVC